MLKLKLKLKWLVPLVLLALLAGCDNGATPGEPTASVVHVGGTAPDFTLTDMQGNQVALSQFRGKVVLVNFWATWCPPCREEMPSMERLYRRYKDKGLVLLAVNIEEQGYQAVSRFLMGKNYSFPILLDTAAEVQNNYKVFRFPETFIIDRNGVIIDKIIGGRDWMSGPVSKKIDFLLNG